MGRHTLEHRSPYRPSAQTGKHAAVSRALDIPDGLAINSPRTAGLRRVPLTVALMATAAGTVTTVAPAVATDSGSIHTASVGRDAFGLPVVANADVVLSAPKVEVRTEPAPPPPPPMVIEPPVTYIQPIVAAPPPPPPAPAPVVAAPAPIVVAPASSAPVVTNRAQAIVNAALAQVGEYQDCVRMVADSLATVGIYWYKWPHEYYQIGYAVSDPLPGDLIYYQNGGSGLAHIAIYIGDGMAVHGGWNGNETRVFSANVGSGPQYIRLN